MRKSKIVLLLALVLATVMVLSSCSLFGGKVDFEDNADGTAYKNEDVAYAAGSAVAELNKATHQASRDAGDLAVFTEDVVTEVEGIPVHNTRTVVYNVATGKVVFNQTNSSTVEYEVECDELVRIDACFFTVLTTTTTKDADNNVTNISYKTVLYDAAGTSVAEANRDTGTGTAYDLIRFDGKCYRATNDGKIAYAFDYAGNKALPTIYFATAEYYYGVGEDLDAFYAYDKNLEIVAYYALPDYAQTAENIVMLENGNVLFQYWVEEHENAEEYDVLDTKYVYIEGAGDYAYETLAKYSLYTVVLNAEKNKAKEIDFDYVVKYSYSAIADQEEWTEELGLNDEVANLVWLAPIEDQRVNDADDAMIWATLSKKGGVGKELEQLTVVPMGDDLPQLIAEKTWKFRTVDGKSYIMNELGEIKAEVPSGFGYTAYVNIDGKLYDKKMEVAYDYTANGYTRCYVLENGALLMNGAGEYAIFANGTTTTLIAKDSDRSLYSANWTINHNYIVVEDTSNMDAENVEDRYTNYDFYNDAGTKLFSVKNVTNISFVKETDNAILISVTAINADSDYVTTYYRLG